MKRILYYSAQVLLLLCSLMLGFVGESSLLLLCISCLICGILLMAVYTLQAAKNWIAFFLYGIAASTHAFYLSAAQPYGPSMLVLMAVMMVCSIAVLIYELRHTLPYRHVFEDVLFTKTALIPEILLNWLMNKASHDQMFSIFSWVLLAITSAYVIASLVQMVRNKRIDSCKAIAAGLLQCCFFTDILSSAWLLIYTIRQEAKEKKAEEEQTKKEKKPSTLLSSSSFSTSSKASHKSAGSAFSKSSSKSKDRS